MSELNAEIAAQRAATASTAVGRRQGNKWWTLAAVCLGTFMLLLDITIVTVALPDIQRALHSSFSDLQWIVDAYALTLAAFLLTGGSLADMYGRRLLYLIGLVIFTGASVLCGFAVSTIMLELSRGLQGVGGAILTSGISWRWIFFVNAPIVVVAVAITVMRVAESRLTTATRPDWGGFVL